MAIKPLRKKKNEYYWLRHAPDRDLVEKQNELKKEVLGVKKGTMSKSLALDIITDITRELTIRESGRRF